MEAKYDPEKLFLNIICGLKMKNGMVKEEPNDLPPMPALEGYKAK